MLIFKPRLVFVYDFSCVWGQKRDIDRNTKKMPTILDYCLVKFVLVIILRVK